ncbi:cell surface protein [Heyndrickxia sporothermodurans]|uniref:cell surface protein n=1 Tax=Heyndrickxia sporothermodurans TaxID=46224 RepID=UPI0035DCAE60
MEMFNIFQSPKHDFQTMITINGEEIFVNGKKKYGIITNPDIKEFNDKYISTDFKTQRGDYIYYDDMYWMVWNQVSVPRAESYKGIMRQIEHDVVFNLYYVNETSKYLLKCPAIISRTSDYTQRYDKITNIFEVDSEIHVFVKDTSRTRKIIDLVGKSYGQIVLGQRNYEITGVSIEKKGYLDITCNLGIRNNESDYVNNIYWKTGETIPSDWAEQIDTTFYNREGVSNLPGVPNGYQSNVTITTSKTDVKDGINGTITATWTDEANRNSYKDFQGYKLRLLQSGTEIAMVNVGLNILTYTFQNLLEGSYTVELYSRFGDNTTILPKTSTITIENGDKGLPSGTEITNVYAVAYDDTGSIGTLIWTAETKKTDFVGFSGYRVRVITSSLFGGDSIRKEVITTSETADMGTGWKGELGWRIEIESIFTDGTSTIYLQPYRITGDELTALPDQP